MRCGRNISKICVEQEGDSLWVEWLKEVTEGTKDRAPIS